MHTAADCLLNRELTAIESNQRRVREPIRFRFEQIVEGSFPTAELGPVIGKAKSHRQDQAAEQGLCHMRSGRDYASVDRVLTPQAIRRDANAAKMASNGCQRLAPI